MKSLAISIALTLTAAPVLAGTPDDHFETDALLPTHVLVEIERLSAHGDRFAKAIEQIRAVALKPSWGFDTCGEAMPMPGS